jgi:hypothetical protein
MLERISRNELQRNSSKVKALTRESEEEEKSLP